MGDDGAGGVGNGMGGKEILFLDGDGEKGTGSDRKARLRGILRKLQVLFCFLAEGVLIAGALYGKKLNAVILGLFVLVQAALWVLLQGKDSRRILGKRKRAEYGRRKSIPIAIFLCVVIIVTLGAVLFRPAAYYDAVYRAEGYVTALLRGSGSGSGLSSSGSINRGNLYRTGAVQLELTASEMPTEPLYLRGFSGGDYVGNGWEAADERAVFEEITEILDWEWSRMIGWMYYSMYFVLNRDGNQVPERELRIVHPDGDYSSFYYRWSQLP